MEKLNIAELLKDCPQGMELDCTMYDDIFFYEITDDQVFPICIKRIDGPPITLTKYGEYADCPSAKCVIFPKGKTTWEGFQRPFKDGDILYAVDEGKEFIFILKHIFENGRVYCYLNLKGDDLRIQNVWLTDYNPTHRLATEEEKQKLFEAIKDNGYKWNAETKTLEKLVEPKFKVGDRVQNKNTNMIGTINLIINDEREYQVALKNGGITYILFEFQDSWELVPNKFDITTLKPFDKVLVRCGNNGLWDPQFFAKYRPHSKFPFTCTYNSWSQCVPYEGNEHLLDTTDDCDEFYKIWE